MQPDRRRVQTAVTGDPHSAEPAYMPTELDEATEFRARAHEYGHTHWCGTLLGGCGGRLSLKIIRERDTVPHFAHRADSNMCARLNRGAERTLGGQSADHLYAHRHLRTWLSEHECAVPDRAEYVGLAPGQACTELVVPTTGKPLRLVFTSDLDHDLMEVAKSPVARDYVWLVRANDALTRVLILNGVPYRRFRLMAEQVHNSRGVQVGVRDGSGDLVWVPLAQCVLNTSTLDQAPPSARTTPALARESTQAMITVSDPLEQALRGLHHALAHGGSRGHIASMAQTVRLQQRAARARGLPPDLAGEAHALLDQAKAALRPRATTPTPQPQPSAARAALHTEREWERARRERRDRETKHVVERLIDKLTWAKLNERSRAYETTRAELVKVLNRPDTSKDITDHIKQRLRDFPKVFFAAPEPAAEPTQRQRPQPRRGRHQDRGRNRGASPAETPPAPTGLEVQARIDDRSRQILKEMRTSNQRPIPRKSPPERW